MTNTPRSLLSTDVKSLLLLRLSALASFSSLSRVHCLPCGALTSCLLIVNVFSFSFSQNVCALSAQPLRASLPLRAPRRYDRRWYMGIFISWKRPWAIILDRSKKLSLILDVSADIVTPDNSPLFHSVWPTHRTYAFYYLLTRVYRLSIWLLAFTVRPPRLSITSFPPTNHTH